MKYDVEYSTHVYVTARGIEAGSRDEAIEKADAMWRGNYPVVTEPSESAPWLDADDIHVSDDWDVNYVTGDNPDVDAAAGDDSEEYDTSSLAKEDARNAWQHDAG